MPRIRSGGYTRRVGIRRRLAYPGGGYRSILARRRTAFGRLVRRSAGPFVYYSAMRRRRTGVWRARY